MSKAAKKNKEKGEAKLKEIKTKKYTRYSIIASIIKGGRPLNEKANKKEEEKKKKEEEELKEGEEPPKLTRCNKCKIGCKKCCKKVARKVKNCFTLCFYLCLCLFLMSLIIVTPVVLKITV